MEPRYPELATLLGQLRANAGLTRKELARRSGLTYDRLAKWEKGENRPSDYQIAVRLADALGLPKSSFDRARLFWLSGEWVERFAGGGGIPAPRCRHVFGRSEELDGVVAKLLNPNPNFRVIVISAFGGYGKTEFARLVASHTLTQGAFSDAVWITLKTSELQIGTGQINPLKPSTTPSLADVMTALLHRLSSRSEDELAARLAAEPILLVIDNLESLPVREREATLSFLQRLLGTGPSRSLVTTRFDVVASYVYKPPFGGLTKSASIALLQDEAHAAVRVTDL